MKAADRLLQAWRIRAAAAYIPPGSRVLDIGCADGALGRLLRSRIQDYVGIDPEVSRPSHESGYSLHRGWFPQDLPDTTPFDIIILLAVVEHFEPEDLPCLAEGCVQMLRPSGRVILTTPSPSVDALLKLGVCLCMIDGMSLDQHHHFDPKEVPPLFSSRGMRMRVCRRFQLGLNNLFVFDKLS